MKKIVYSFVILIIIGFLLMTCENKPTEVSQNSPPPNNLLKTSQDLGPHAKLSVTYLTGESELTSDQIKKGKEIQEEFGIEPGDEPVPDDVKLITPEEFDKYNISPPTELELIQKGLEIAEHSKAILMSKTQWPCGDCTDCHEGGGQPDDWYYWTDIEGSTVGYNKIVKPETVSLSETFCIDRIFTGQYVYINGVYSYYGYDNNYDDYIAGVYGVFTYAAWRTKYWEVVGRHEFEDIDFINLYTWTNDDLLY